MLNNKLKLMMGVLVICLSFTGCAKPATEDIVKTETQIVPVSVTSIEYGDVYESVYSIGEVKSSDIFHVNAMAAGKVTEVNYGVGDLVNEGDVLFKVEADDFDSDMNSKLTQASNGVSQAKLGLDNAKTNLDRVQKLFDGGVSSKAELDNMKSSYDNSKITYSNAVNSYETLKYSYNSASENYEMTSPVTGIITSTTIVKDMMASNQNGFTIEVIDTYKVSSSIGSKYINDIKVGQEVEVYVSTLDTLLKGSIKSVSLNATNGMYPIEIQLETIDERLKSGMYSELWIVTSDVANGLWIPSMALMQENGDSFVYTVDNGIAEKVMVEVLSMRGDEIAIKSSLNQEDQLITFGKEYVMQGSEVEIK